LYINKTYKKMELFTILNAGLCVEIELTIKGNEKIFEFENPLMVNIIRNIDGSYNLDIPEFLENHQVINLKKKYLGVPKGWLLENEGMKVALISDVLNESLQSIFNKTEPKEDVGSLLRKILQDAVASEDYESCHLINKMLDEVATKKTDILF
jgi:hypothetical protein